MGWTREEIERLTGHVPEATGVYLMRDRAGKVLYVGKAVNLRNRVLSYFHKSSDPRPFVKMLSSFLDRIEVVVTSNEKEALILENELIKKYKPPFNILLRDDKNYLYLRIDEKADFPRLDLARRRKTDGALYFGPYHTASSVRATHALINRYFGLRTCRDTDFRNRSRPCLEHQMGRCLGPCCLRVSKEEYRARVEAAIMFLKGRHAEVVRELERRMFEAAEVENFEEAARLRDQIRAIRAAMERQSVVLQVAEDVDAVGLAKEGTHCALVVMRYEGGVLRDRIPFCLDGVVAPIEEVGESLLLQYYGRAPIPDIVLVPRGLVGNAFGEVLSVRGGKEVKVLEPVRGPFKDAVENARLNAEQVLSEALSSYEASGRALEELQDLLRLQKLPRRIETFDISQIQGTEVVGAVVVFEDGRPKRSAYRTYKVKGEFSLDGAKVGGDVGALREVLSRRLRRAIEEKTIPDLIVIDGGEAQARLGRELVEAYGLEGEVEVVAIAKARVLGGGTGPASHLPERLYVAKEAVGVREEEVEFLVPPQNHKGLLLLARMRDEAHRFAVSFHRKRRSKRMVLSVLDGIKGLGPKRRMALLRHFGSVEAMRRATLEALSSLVPKEVATSLYARLHEEYG